MGAGWSDRVSEATAVALFSALEWPEGALGRRALLAFEPYDASVFSLNQDRAGDPISCLLERGFARQVPGVWAFPHVEGHSLGIFEDFDEVALIDEADDLFVYPLSALPQDWLGHVERERCCLLVTGVGLSLATAGFKGVERAAARGEAVGGAVMLVDPADHD